jgi:predicted HTH transcriptional regulator
LQEIAEKQGMTPRQIDRHVRVLKKSGVLRRVGSKKTGRWEVISPDPKH